jgi:hypothetical protein
MHAPLGGGGERCKGLRAAVGFGEIGYPPVGKVPFLVHRVDGGMPKCAG